MRKTYAFTLILVFALGMSLKANFDQNNTIKELRGEAAAWKEAAKPIIIGNTGISVWSVAHDEMSPTDLENALNPCHVRDDRERERMFQKGCSGGKPLTGVSYSVEFASEKDREYDPSKEVPF